MIARLKGVVSEVEEKSLIIDVQGVGYRVAVLPHLRKKVTSGEEIALKIYHHVSAEAEDMFGFETAEQLEYFELLLTVPSVGVKTAMNILEVAPPPVLTQAVAESDLALLTKVSGVGRKTAERIIVELKGKLKKLATAKGPSGSVQQEAIEALVSIGYTVSQARTAVTKLPPTVATVEDAVRWVLKGGK